MLSINIWDIIWTIINFFLLYFVLNKLLYKPVIRFMDERRERIEAGLAQEKAANMQIAESEAGAEAEIAGSRAQAKLIVEKAMAENAQHHTLLLHGMQDESAREKQRAREKLAAVRSAEEEKLSGSTGDFAAILMDRILNE